MGNGKKSFWTHLEEMGASEPGGGKPSWRTTLVDIVAYMNKNGFDAEDFDVELALDTYGQIPGHFPWKVCRTGNNVTFT